MVFDVVVINSWDVMMFIVRYHMSAGLPQEEKKCDPGDMEAYVGEPVELGITGITIHTKEDREIFVLDVESRDLKYLRKAIGLKYNKKPTPRISICSSYIYVVLSFEFI